MYRKSRLGRYLCSSGLIGIALISFSGAAAAADTTYRFDIPAEPLGQALTDFSRISSKQIVFSEDLIASRQSNGLHGQYTADQALSALLANSGLKAEADPAGVLMVHLSPVQAPPKAEPSIIPPPVRTVNIAASHSEPLSVETIVVTSTRITSRGFSAPTPVTVLAAADLQQDALPNIFDSISQLPSLQGNTGSAQGNGGTSSGNNGLSTFNARGLGTNRTLTLIDGQRIVPAYVTGITDVSEFPQLLIQRVDVTTGGASASWGSDAVGGVVNFVTDKNFNGIKGNVQGGITTYGDDTGALVQLAGGTGLLDGRAHIEASIEYYHNDGVPAANKPGGELPNGRCCQTFVGTNSLTPNPLAYTPTTTPAGVPEITELSGPATGSQNITYSTYGLITSGPLKGISFDASGTPVQFKYGTNCVGSVCSGGDLSNNYVGTTIDAELTRSVFYTRLSYEIAPNIELYGTFNLGNVQSANQPNAGHAPPAALTIACGNAPGGANAYLPASINAACVANNITSFSYGVSALVLPAYIRVHNLRQQRRYVIGADGAFNLFDKDWTFSAYFEHGENDTSIHIKDMSLQPAYTAAVDAVMGPNGTIVCRSGVAGCHPINLFGNNPVDAAAYAFINPKDGPYQLTAQRQEAAGVAVNGTPFKGWAGDISVAYGAEYREEAYKTRADPYGNGVTAADPNTAQYPDNPLLNTFGNNWYAGNFHDGRGDYHVAEAFLEVRLPLLDSVPWGRVELDAGARGTIYSTSGFVDTWKVGATWDTPLDGVRLRALQSRDVRAPNLNELFAANLVQSQQVINRLDGSGPRILVSTTGNPNLKPEAAQTTEVGLVFQPDYISGLSASFDYYRVGVKKEIASLTSQQEIDLCQISGNQSYCSLFTLTGSNPVVHLAPINLASAITDGIDIEISYQFDMKSWGIPGKFVFRGLSNHVSKFITDTGVPGQPLTEGAGNFTAPGGTSFVGGVPLWKNYLIQTWMVDRIVLGITERFYSDGAINPYAIQCQAPDCPAPTVQNPTINMNHTQGPFFVDIGGSYDIGNGMQAFFKVDNMMDYSPRPFTPAYEADPIGRTYRVGFRFSQ
jgi:outer membrane receptor protein involved in Fe transport